MPTYEYECSKCGTVTEVFQSMTEKPRRKLKKDDDPQCDCNASVSRLIGKGAGIIFKGSGFYETDYRSKDYKKDAEADKPKSESKSDSKSESKSETKTEKKKTKKASKSKDSGD